ncbi:hypothetical protein IT571_08220 [Candidatus Sumerlaeota bacterium]|nr:hypothetical protein [Candidatus Sumerlaeota bacterium]
MTPRSDKDAIPPQAGWRAPLLGGALAALLWAPMLAVPFYHDDWGALYHARQEIMRGDLIFSAFVADDDPGRFWRPISVALHWRAIAGLLYGNAFFAHILNFTLLIAGCAAVGRLASSLAWRLRGTTAPHAGFLAAFFYGMQGAMFLPAAWVSGAQELYAILFSALFLLAVGVWGWGFHSRNEATRRLWIASCPVLLALALLSKEGAAVLPLLAVILSWLLRRRPAGKWLPLICVIVYVAWFALRSRHVAPLPQDSPYSYKFGTNVVRNLGALAAFSLNLPREALQVAHFAGERWWLAWGGACVAFQAIAVGLMARCARLDRRTVLALAGFWLAAILPVLPLAWNCYPYYALLGLMALAIVAAMGGATHTRIIALVSSLLSALILIGGELFLPYPAPLAAARWGERQLENLRASEFRARADRYAVEVDDRSFGAMGNEHGIAMALGIRAEQVARPQDSHEGCAYVIRMPRAAARTDVVIERRN